MNITNIVFLLLLVALLGWQLVPLIRAWKLQGASAPQIDDLISAEQQKMARLLFYFWSPNCIMCRNVTPVIDELMTRRDDVIKFNVTENLDAAQRFKIIGTPTLVLLKQGKISKILVGAKSQARIQALLEQ